MALSRIPSHQFTVDSNITVPTGKQLNAVDTAGLYAPGTVLQVVNLDYKDTFSSTSATPADVTGFAATITPKFAASKILVNVSIAFGYTNDAYPYVLLLRNGVSVSTGNTATGNQINVFLAGFGTNLPGSTYWRMQQTSKEFMDSPNTTSSVTYKLQLASPYNNYAGYINRQSDYTNAVYVQRPTSTITLMEIAQ